MHNSEKRKQANILIIGGTGMLEKATLALVQQGNRVTVVGRSVSRLQSLKNKADNLQGTLFPLSLDYTKLSEFEAKISSIIDIHGPPDTIISWIHSTGVKALLSLAQLVEKEKDPPSFFHIQGSAGADPTRLEIPEYAQLKSNYFIAYREIILGFMIDHSGSRWLTHEEISDGVLDAVAQDTERSIVGVVEPWSSRP